MKARLCQKLGVTVATILLPGQKSPLFYMSASVTGEKLYSSRIEGYVWLFPPLWKVEPLPVGTA